MALLPAGFAVPPWPYAFVLVTAAAVAIGWLWRLAPAVTAGTVLGLAPWMGLGSALHAWYVFDLAPPAVAPLLGAPAVYLTAFICLGTVWVGLVAAEPGDPRAVARRLALVGTAGFVLAAGSVLAVAGIASPCWPAAGLLAAVAATPAAWALLTRVAPEAAVTGYSGRLVVFAHALDGVSTAVGVDVLGFGERTPLSRAVLDAAAALPTADVLGVGWLFVAVKLAVAAAVVWVFADLVEADARQAHLLLAVVAAVGLGPGLHNLLLFVAAG